VEHRLLVSHKNIGLENFSRDQKKTLVYFASNTVHNLNIYMRFFLTFWVIHSIFTKAIGQHQREAGEVRSSAPSCGCGQTVQWRSAAHSSGSVSRGQATPTPGENRALLPNPPNWGWVDPPFSFGSWM
jgi:hypothetical protein